MRLQRRVIQRNRAARRLRHFGGEFFHVVQRADVGFGHEVENDVFVLLFAFEAGTVLDERGRVLKHEAVRATLVRDFAQKNHGFDAWHREITIREREAEVGTADGQR